MSRENERHLVEALVVLLAMVWSLVLVWNDDPSAGAFFGGYFVAGLAGVLLPARVGVAMGVPYLIALYAAQTRGADRPAGSVLLIVLGAIACFAIGGYVRSRHRGHDTDHTTTTAQEAPVLEPEIVPPGPRTLPLLAAEFEHDTSLPCPVAVSGQPVDLPEPVGELLHLVAREALADVREHARAQRVRVAVEHRAEEVRLTVQDHGELTGRDPVHVAELGQRAENLGGALETTPTDDGQRVSLRLPLR
ncbi:sensor histidine kinase [Saccharopolyspora mangrovi]|uniref:histidine kinase n=1 Tax=Saccharopolyspora mangrovi TaxID=3082379 RepID=A0ABU6ABS2_9PSEU|nr:hypothetical protein [Saccharopolyspora sp. S2-29]MEB3369012.1 hypothetical protein [Saccharopolyspora sp. S2-29]